MPEELEPINLSLSQREQVQKRIAEYLTDSTSVHAFAHGAVARAAALPLMFDWTGFMALRPDGQVVWIPYDDEPGDVEPVRDVLVRNIGLFRGTKLHPGLPILLPPRPPDAIECPDCKGTGKIILPQMPADLSESLMCYCGGIGWLPSGTRRRY